MECHSVTVHEFSTIEKVYCMNNFRYHMQWYDVTEIDTLPVPICAYDDAAAKIGHSSVLPTILLQTPQSASHFLEFAPIRQVIEHKWNKYRWFVGAWGILHLMFMFGLTITAVRRAQLNKDPVANPNETFHDRPHFIYMVRQNAFETAICVIGFIFGIAYICLEIKRIITQVNQKHIIPANIYTALKFPHSYIIVKWLFVLFNLCLIIDFIVAVIQVESYENYMLMAAEIIGAYLLLFFIQMIQPFSFFTALIQTAIVDLAIFAIVMMIFLLSFSTAMYMVMQGADFEDDTFRSYTSTLIKMYNFMLGFGDVESFFQAKPPAAAFAILNAFVLLTTVLLLNALIAIMANTCSSLLPQYGSVTGSTLQYRLHKLSAILFIEDILPQQMRVGAGEIQTRTRFINGEWYKDVKRRMIQQTSLTMQFRKI